MPGMFLFPKILVGFWVLSMILFGAAAWLGMRWTAGAGTMFLMLHMLAGMFAAFVNVLMHTAVMMHS
ncbi:MAG: hypothetical protein ACYS22_10105, partial [Planctomycetota bacterium]